VVALVLAPACVAPDDVGAADNIEPLVRRWQHEIADELIVCRFIDLEAEVTLGVRHLSVGSGLEPVRVLTKREHIHFDNHEW
jgi:hypothetical protein